MSTKQTIYRVPPRTKITFEGRDYVAGDVIRGYTPPVELEKTDIKKEGYDEL